jgi:hypothetical protein
MAKKKLTKKELAAIEKKKRDKTKAEALENDNSNETVKGVTSNPKLCGKCPKMCGVVYCNSCIIFNKIK